MFKKMSESDGNVLGYQVIGDISKEDYTALVAEVQTIIDAQGSVRMLLDMEQFKSEKASAWGSDLNFGRTYRKLIEKMAIVGDKKWESWMTKLVEPFYAREAKYFHTADIDEAWRWLKEDGDSGE